MRNLLLEYSATYTLPSVSTVKRPRPPPPPGMVKVGEAPSVAPAVALPTQVETFHCVRASAVGQTAQLAAPTLLERPGWQGVQAPAACAAAVPAGQG